MALRRMDDDGGARFGVGERVVVGEVLEARRHRRDGQLVGVEVVGLARDPQAAQVAQVGRLEPARLAGGAQHPHVEPRVVGGENVAVDEVEQGIHLIAPQRRVDDVGGGDAVDARVPLEHVVEAERRAD